MEPGHGASRGRVQSSWILTPALVRLWPEGMPWPDLKSLRANRNPWTPKKKSREDLRVSDSLSTQQSFPRKQGDKKIINPL